MGANSRRRFKPYHKKILLHLSHKIFLNKIWQHRGAGPEAWEGEGGVAVSKTHNKIFSCMGFYSRLKNVILKVFSEQLLSPI